MPHLNTDLVETPFEIKTSSALGSGDNVNLKFYSAGGDMAGGFELYFAETLKYHVGWCDTGRHTVPIKLPSTKEMVWKIKLNRTSGIRLQVLCNEEEMLNFLVTTCSFNNWRAHWPYSVARVRIQNDDSATKFYRTKIENGNPDCQAEKVKAQSIFSFLFQHFPTYRKKKI